MTARRVPLAELDALTDQIEPLLARLDAIWRRVEAELRAQRTPIRAAASSEVWVAPPADARTSRGVASAGKCRPLTQVDNRHGPDRCRAVATTP